jgi:UDP-2-acetamido-2-deoxy-ribo-hexuluronate aminotransferase
LQTAIPRGLRTSFKRRSSALAPARLIQPVRLAGVPTVNANAVWAQYTISINDRDVVAARLQEQAVPTGIHYPKPLHRQLAYRSYPQAPDGLTISEMMASRVLSLPMDPYLDPATQARIIEAVRDAVGC